MAQAEAFIPSTLAAGEHRAAALLRTVVMGLISFLTFVDLFAAQAILPTLVKVYQVTPAAMGFAVNASTIGMAAAGIGITFVSRRINRRQGIWVSLACLSVPTFLLAAAPDLTTFTLLRVAQGLFMSAAFALTIAYLAERCSAEDAAGALAACITGNVASNLFGRMLSASVADSFGLEANFYFFAGLNLAGAALVFFSLARTQRMAAVERSGGSPLRIWREHLRNPALRLGFGIGFCILFVFIGTYTYVNFVLVRAPISVSPMALGFVYLVFLPAIFTTPVAGRIATRVGAKSSFWGSLATAGAGLPLLLVPHLAPVMLGLALIGVGTFFAQATATGFISRSATADRGAASGMYLASYYLGGLAGAAVLGQVYDRFGWTACVLGLGFALATGALLAAFIRTPRP
ncbi:MAG: transporter [Rhodospirillales bacterium]|nr:transporter [Rhodospirillales bacterium]